MYSKLAERLRFSLEPVAIWFTDEKPEGALQFEEGKRGCIAERLISSSEGKVSAFDKKTYGCVGGGVGICFGDTFTKDNEPIECRLSTGDEALKKTGKTYKTSLGHGERFFATPEVVAEWRASFPYIETPKKYVVFRPLSMAEESNPPDIVFMFADPDQLSALVILSGFRRGDIVNAVAPFVAACQTIALACKEIGNERPKGVIGFFDLAQRHRIPRDLLSYTVPYTMYKEIEKNTEDGCLTEKMWEMIVVPPDIR
ncbi:MAG: DUF169 domain-containing protein [Methanomassiliicoccaceae archaeon]|nr:DUF169 domain-containing protein [Methanomassiliicoccaceae archaeon]